MAAGAHTVRNFNQQIVEASGQVPTPTLWARRPHSLDHSVAADAQ